MSPASSSASQSGFVSRLLASLALGAMLALWGGTVAVHAQCKTATECFDVLINKPQNAYIDTGTGEYGFVDLAITYADLFRTIVTIIAVLLIIIEGFNMVLADGDAAVIKKSGTAIGWALVGLIVMNIAQVGVKVFFDTGGIFGGIDPLNKDIPKNFYEEIVLPLIDFALTFLVGIATLMIILTGVQILTAAGDEGKIKKLYGRLATMITGLGILIVARPVIGIFYGTGKVDPQPNEAIDLFLQILNYLLGFLGLAAVIVIVIAGLMMVFYLGNDGAVKKARSTIFGALLGLALIISAYTIVTFFILPAFT